MVLTDEYIVIPPKTKIGKGAREIDLSGAFALAMETLYHDTGTPSMDGVHKDLSESHKNFYKNYTIRTRFVYPFRYSSTSAATERPSAMAHTTRDCPRRMSPAAKTFSTLVVNLPSTVRTIRS